MTAVSVADEAAGRRRGARSGINRRFLRLLLMVVLPLVAVLAGTWWYLGAARYVSTDDAYIAADAVAVSSDVVDPWNPMSFATSSGS